MRGKGELIRKIASNILVAKQSNRCNIELSWVHKNWLVALVTGQSRLTAYGQVSWFQETEAETLCLNKFYSILQHLSSAWSLWQSGHLVTVCFGPGFPEVCSCEVLSAPRSLFLSLAYFPSFPPESIWEKTGSFAKSDSSLTKLTNSLNDTLVRDFVQVSYAWQHHLILEYEDSLVLTRTRFSFESNSLIDSIIFTASWQRNRKSENSCNATLCQSFAKAWTGLPKRWSKSLGASVYECSQSTARNPLTTLLALPAVYLWRK